MGTSIEGKQYTVVQASANSDRANELPTLTLFQADGTPLTVNQEVMPVQAASTASDVAGLKTDFNALLTKLKNAGYMATS